MPKPLRRQTNGLVISFIEYFERECRNGGLLLPLESIRERVADAFKLSLGSVNRLSAKAGQLLASPSKQRPRNKPTAEINPSQKAEVRNVIYEMYQQNTPAQLQDKTEYGMLHLRNIGEQAVQMLIRSVKS